MDSKEIPTRSVTINGVEYPLRFGHNAQYRLDQRVYEMEEERIARGGKPRSQMAIKDEKTGKVSLIALPGYEILKTYPLHTWTLVLFWAAIETGRVKSGKGTRPYTLDDAGELIDAAGGLGEIEPELMLAFNDSHPGIYSTEYLDGLTKRLEARKNGQPEPESAPVPESPPTAKRGKSGSSKDSK